MAQANEPNTTNLSAFTRRMFLRRTASVSAMAVAGVAPVVTTKALASPAIETPELLAAAKGLADAEAAYQKAVASKRAARAVYDAHAPAVPDGVLYRFGTGPMARHMAGRGSDPSPYNWCVEREQDVEGREVYQPNITIEGKVYAQHTRQLIQSDKLRKEFEPDGMFHKSRSKAAKEAKERLRLAEEYEAGIARARTLSGIKDAIDVAYFSAIDVARAANDVHEQEAHTVTGVVMKARALLALHNIPSREVLQDAGHCFGPGLAADVERLLSVRA